MVSWHTRKHYLKWRNLLNSKRGVETIEWIGIAAVVLAILVGVLVFVSVRGGGQIGTTILDTLALLIEGSSDSDFTANPQRNGGASHAPPALIQPSIGLPVLFIGNPGASQPDVGQPQVGASESDQSNPDSNSNDRLEWYEKLPDCPCQVPTANNPNPPGWTEPGPGWSKPEDIGWNIFHPGAKYEMRWTGSPGGPGQQCTYDANGNLITEGIAAGTPDKVAPSDGNKWDHFREDVRPFLPGFIRNRLGFEENEELDSYLENWPPNQGNDGTGNPC